MRLMQEERYSTRARIYSAWHHRMITPRFVCIEQAQRLAMIDLDGALYVEYDGNRREPLALIESARDTGQAWKSSSITVARARGARLPAYVQLYRPGELRNPADPRQPDITLFRIRRLYPRPEKQCRTLTPPGWARALLQIRSWSTRWLDLEAANEPVYGAYR
jgi:hypothetical protein